ncbi:MAG: 50S ribosomal protein L22 [candidate division TM6 bacterium GW2011_GWF2_30_66]|jgi:large subunit ribosomal protein L22|nr:MAG: 50S ribosomal protein L22 [candidate division TM6 bacterium GW2011_GWF2_30_66]
MQFGASAKYLRYSPYKLRPLVDVLRGKNVEYALNWLSTCSLKKVVPIKKVIESAVANAKNLQNLEAEALWISKIFVDQGPSYRYFSPGAMGRANPRTKRLSHISVILEKKQEA